MGYIPDYAGISVWVKYELEKQELEDTDYISLARKNRTENEYQVGVLEMQARSKKVSVEEFLQAEAVRLKEKALDDLQEKYNLSKAKSKSTRKEVLDKYSQLSEKVERAVTTAKKSLLDMPFNFPVEEKKEDA